MPEEAKQTQDAKQQKTEVSQPKPSGSGLMKYILFGVGAMVVVIVLVVVALMFLGGDTADKTDPGGDKRSELVSRPELPKPSGRTDKPAAETQAETTDSQMEEVDLSEEDASAIDKIMESLEFLDYEPDEDELATEEGRMTKDDSLEQVNWLEKEKSALTAREKELNSREKDLERRERDVNKKLLNLEQVESARTAQLAKLYDGMDARSVAKLMANLDDRTVVSILPRMKLKNASAVLQLLPAQRAAKLSKEMITITSN